MANDSPGVTGFAQVALSVRDLETALAFYRDVLASRTSFRLRRAGVLQCGPRGSC